MEEAFHAKTILALQGRYVDPFFALPQAKAIFKAGRAQRPPANNTFRLVWFLGKNITTIVPTSDSIFLSRSRSTPTTLGIGLGWLIEDLLASGGHFLVTEPAIVKFWDMRFALFLCVGFLFKLISYAFQTNFLFFSSNKFCCY